MLIFTPGSTTASAAIVKQIWVMQREARPPLCTLYLALRDKVVTRMMREF